MTLKQFCDRLQWFGTGALFLALGIWSKAAAQPVKLPPPPPDSETGQQKMAEASESITAKMPRANGNRPKVLKFYADWCSKCKEFAPVVDGAKNKYSDKVDFQFVNVDDPANATLVEKYDITNLPTTVYLDKEGEEVSTMVGYVGSHQVNWAVNMLVIEGQQAASLAKAGSVN